MLEQVHAVYPILTQDRLARIVSRLQLIRHYYLNRIDRNLLMFSLTWILVSYPQRLFQDNLLSSGISRRYRQTTWLGQENCSEGLKTIWERDCQIY